MFFSVFAVALLAEGVDRNTFAGPHKAQIGVALLAEGVDRNASTSVSTPIGSEVALLAEGVDRNTFAGPHKAQIGGRPPRGGRG